MLRPTAQLKKLMFKHNKYVLLVNTKWEFQVYFTFNNLTPYYQPLTTPHSRFGKELILCSKISPNNSN